MPYDLRPDYRRDSEFSKLLTRATAVDLVRVNLEIARDVHRDLDFQTPLVWLAEQASELKNSLSSSASEREALACLAEGLCGRQGLHGSAEAFETPDGSYIHRVIENRQGIPLSLTLIFMEVSRQIGLVLEPVSAPQHFLCRCEAPEGPLFVDAFTDGRVMSEAECLNWLEHLTDLDAETLRHSLEPASPRMVTRRMLNNLKVVYAKREEWIPAWQVQHRLTHLQPGSYQQRRDLGILALHAERTGEAIDLLTACLKSCPEAERDVLKRHLDAARSKQARWN